MDYSVPILTELVLVTTDIERTLKIAARLSTEQYQVLALLGESSEPLTPSSIARSLSLAPSSIATALGKLKSVGAIAMKESPEDGRLELLELSGIGRMLLAAADKALSNLLTSLWRPLSHDQRTMKLWGSARAMSKRNLIRVNKGEVDVSSAYCNATLLSLRTCKNSLAAHGLSVNEYRVLKTCTDAVDNRRQLSTGDIGKTLVMSSSLLAQTTGALEKRGLVQRIPSLDDARVRLIVPAESGLSVVADARRDVLRAMRKGLVPMSRATVDEYGRMAEQIIDHYRFIL